MKPPIFDYFRAESIQDAISLLQEGGDNTKLIAGGQSLMPMLNFRLLAPERLVDISQLHELKRVREQEGYLSIGAGVRHIQLETSDVVATHFPVITEAMAHVAHLAIRNKGTIGGSLCHGDPAAELPMLIQLLDAQLYIVGPEGERTIEASDFYFGALSPDIEEDEILVEIRLPYLNDNTAWAFEEFTRKSGDFAVAACAVLMRVSENVIEEVRISFMGVNEMPLRASRIEELVLGKTISKSVMDQAVAGVYEVVEPNTDLQASADYKRHLVGVLTSRALSDAWSKAGGEVYE